MTVASCTLCGEPMPVQDLNRFGECVECVDHADHLISEGWDR